jgi:formylmethanofuran dehydrogenase subunit B
MSQIDDTTLDGRPTGRLQAGACPFCAMLCDDLSLPLHKPQSAPSGTTCAKATDGFSRALQAAAANPLINGIQGSWPQALQKARSLLQSARFPLFHGLIGDLLDCRAALRLAERYGGVVDHEDGDAIARSLAVYQDSGWITTSLGEVRNRADLVVIVGDQPDAALPRLREKLFASTDRLHAEQAPRLVELTTDPLDIIDQVRILFGARPLPAPDDRAVDLHELLLHSRYPVFLPVPKENPYAEMILRSTADLVRIINETSRAALLMLVSGTGGATAQHAAAWHSGFGIRTSFALGFPEQDLHRYAGTRLLQGEESDLLVWISSLSDQAPPACKQPSIVIGHPMMRFDDRPPDVFLPVAVPGVHRSGFLHRADGLHMLPLQAIAESDLPGTAELAEQLLESTTEAESPC